MISEVEAQTSVLDLELLAHEALKKRSITKIAESFESQQDEPITESIKDSQTVPDTMPMTVPDEAQAAPLTPKKPHNAPKVKSGRTMTSKFSAERKTLEKNLRQQARRHDQDVMKVMEQALHDHFAQLDKEREDYLALMQGLKETISSQSVQFASSCQEAASGAAKSEVERMISWFQEEFMKELDQKSHEYEDLRAASEKKAVKMSEENEHKSQRILVLDERIKELASHLPSDVRRELSAEMGIELGSVAVTEKATKHETSLLQRLTAAFKRQPKAKPAKPNHGKKTSSNKKMPKL